MSTGDSVEYVEAVHGYDYTNDKGDAVAIEKGKHYVLLEKTNNEWWHVGEISGKKRNFYVPAQYVHCIDHVETQPDDEVFSASGDESGSSSGSDEYDSAEDHEEEHEPVKIIVPKGKKLPEIPGTSRAIPVNNKAGNRLSTFKPPTSVSSTPPADYDAEVVKSKTPPKSVDNVRELPTRTIHCIDTPPPPGPTEPPPSKDETLGTSCTDGGRGYEPVVYANLEAIRGTAMIPDSETQGATEYANLSVIQASLRPPPIPDPQNHIKALHDDWGVYTDTESGRLLYYNTLTKETTWKPPRVPDKQISDGENNNSLEKKEAQPNGNVRVIKPLPRGWSEEKTEKGRPVYVNQATKEKWLASVDGDGRQYFYKEGSQDSTWQLPELIGQSQSVSDSLKHVDVEARKTALRERFSKSKSMYVDAKERQESQRKSTTLPTNMTRSFGMVLENNNPPLKEENSKESGTVTSQVFLMEPRDGILNKTKVMENGKKLKKNWSQSYVKLIGSNLVFYKDQKASAQRPGSPHGKPDLILNLHGAKVENGPRDKSSKKNVVLLSSFRPSEETQYLLQHDDFAKMQNWYIALSETVQGLGQGLEFPGPVTEEVNKNGSPPPNADSGLKRGKSTKDRQKNAGAQKSPGAQKTSGTQKNTNMQRSVSLEDPASQERKRRIRDILLNFISRRPSPEVLKEKGIIREGVFGSDLTQLCEREKVTVPNFVTRSIATIENRGLDHDGLYRVSGNASVIQKLRFTVDQEETYNLDDQDLWDVHVLTGTLKLFFRELKDPLFPLNFYDKFVAAVQLQYSVAKLKAFKDLVSVLPKCHYETIKLLFKHLNKVTNQSKENRMQSHNLAIVFGPTLLWPQVKAPNMAVSLIFQNRIVEFILLEYDNIFR